jgi:hypothetical protein
VNLGRALFGPYRQLVQPDLPISVEKATKFLRGLGKWFE